MKFSSFIILTAAGLAIAAPITPVSTEKKLTIEPVGVAKRQTTLDPVVDATHGKLPVPVKRATPSVSSLGALTSAVPGGLPVGKRQLGGLVPSGSSDGSETAEEPTIPEAPKDPSSVTDGATEIDDGTAESTTSSATSALDGLPVGKRQLGSLIPSSSSKDDGSETAEEPKIPKEPKEPKEPSTVTDGKTEIDDGTAQPSTSSATSALGGLPIGKRQLSSITDMLSPKPADPEDETAPEEADDGASEEAEEPEEGEEAPAEGEEAPAAEEEDPAPPAKKSALDSILKRQLGGLTKGLLPSSEPKDADADAAAAADDDDDEKDPDTTVKSTTHTADDGTNGANSFDAAPEETAEKKPAEEEEEEEAKPTVEAAPAKNATESASLKKEIYGLLGM